MPLWIYGDVGHVLPHQQRPQAVDRTRPLSAYRLLFSPEEWLVANIKLDKIKDYRLRTMTSVAHVCSSQRKHLRRPLPTFRGQPKKSGMGYCYN